MLAPEAGQARLVGRKTDRLDRESAAFHQRVYAGYQAMAASGKHRFKLIDAGASPRAMLDQALEHLKRLEHGLLKYL
jgi:dTMP kinase